GAVSELGQAVKEVLTAAFAELNAQGGIYQRQIELKVAETGDTPAASRVNIERLIKDEKVFAMVGSFVAGAEKEITTLLAEQAVPLVGPLTLDPKNGPPLNRQVFYLTSGYAEQARALVSFVTRQANSKNQLLAVVYPPGTINKSAVDAIRTQAQKDSLRAPEVIEYANFDPAATVKQLKDKGASTVFLLGTGPDFDAFVKEAEKANWFPQLLLQAGGVSGSIFNAPAGFDGKLFFSVPTAPSDQTQTAIQEYRQLAEKYKLPQKHL